MSDFNQAIVLGNLTKDPELRYTPNGQVVTSFSVATNRRWTNKETNQPQEATEFHNIVAWGKLAEICGQILYKGRKTLIVGRLQTRSWEGQDGNKRYITEIVADHISATGAPRSTGEGSISNIANPVVKNDNSQINKDENKKTDSNNNGSEEINLDDIPF
ncbi:MAG: hypothetical protein ACD_58C00071G0009 [uncultured bacterium]|nr:MAG: hypothetical protein ACD_58C00071G0009 [uncultured bacterium]